MKRALTPEQIEQLHQFCAKHYVPYYDLQVELVDHMASAIEEHWVKHPDTSFDKAMSNIYSEFGITGFSKVRMQKEMYLMKKYQRMLWGYVGQFFKLPKIILTIILSLLIFMLFRSTKNDSLIVFIYIATVIIFELIFYIHIYPKYYSIRKLTKKKLIMSNIFRNVQGGFIIMPVIIFNFFGFLGNNRFLSFPLWLEILASLLLVSFTFLIISFSFYIPRMIRKHFEEEFTQLVNS